MAKLRIIEVHRVDFSDGTSYYTKKLSVAKAIMKGCDEWSKGHPPTAHLASSLVILHGKQVIAITDDGGYEENIVLLDKVPEELV